jgi:hypothetical protein
VTALRSLYFPIVASEELKLDLCGCLREERVERDPVLSGLLNEDVESFVDSNLGIKSCLFCLTLLTLLACAIVVLVHTVIVVFLFDLLA